MKLNFRRQGNDRGWPGYILWGRVRTSTAGLLLAFIVLSWVAQTFQPEPTPPEASTQVVPPGFVPDPAYTWVPRTNVEQPRETRRSYPDTTTTTTTTTTSPSAITTTEASPTDTTTGSTSPTPSTVDPDGPGPLPPTTVTDPDGAGPLPPQAVPSTVTTVPPTTVTAPTTSPAPVLGPIRPGR